MSTEETTPLPTEEQPLQQVEVEETQEEENADVNMIQDEEATETVPESAIDNNNKPHEINYEEEAQKLEERALKFLAKQTHPIIIPSFAQWFDISKIHEIERRSNPDFFDDSSRFKSPKSYKDTRNFIINTYRLSPFEYLTITAVRRNIAMDVSSIVKIHSFLERWGLINYQIDPKSKPSLIGPAFTGHFQMILDAPQGLKPMIPTETITTQNDDGSTVETEGGSNKVKRGPFPLNLSLRQNVYDSTNDFNALQSASSNNNKQPINKTYVCHTCGNNAVTVRYHNLRSKDSNLCARCFKEGHFGANFQSTDFIKLENDSKRTKTWSDQEILLLLEGLEMYEDQWEKIVDHVGGTKSLEDCVEKFLSLPIEDKYINDIIGSKKDVQKDNDEGTSKPIFNTVEAVDATIKSLLGGLHKETLDEAIPESANRLAEKYIQETQAVALELVNLTMKKLDLKYSKLIKLETSLEEERARYIKETERANNDRLSLSKQVAELNEELSKLNISKRVVLASEQVDAGIKLVDNDEENDELNETNTALKKISDQEAEALSQLEPQVYKPWSL
ncbi:Rsc8p NDAI_0G01960 [Naumovozyma dairenensis CBS 421]|uniref:SWIRM domain-containing protein n=1 Tax=Naumovozyma dairenensis (strain ATCC 10597 / BCRC 20456 / CBS 421 / NBRC 0211 / NRRL Y-12639) TaxID=1071378 RepID=G0WDW0_NAUDC|nr:hypothetical protein NDAI_0G01960 [Naumovozyma dairenensis CBS 421]CCD25971.2 hypothetical protein NDAI_0G01960 [Naumovozyma dairenensis CBS 421]